MKLEKWYEKAGKILEKQISSDDIRYYSDDDGTVFCNAHGSWCLFDPGSSVLSASPKDSMYYLKTLWEKFVVNSYSTLAENIVSGSMCKDGTKARQFSSGDITVYAAERFLRMFPKNTMFYIEESTKPIICGIWENDKLNIIGFVMPVLNLAGFEAAA